MPLEIWRFNLFGGLHAQSDQRTLNGLAMRRVGALLACLVIRSPQSVPREEILALLWPDQPTDVVRNRLRVLLSSLRQNIDPVDGASESVLAADRLSLRLVADLFTSDYGDFLNRLQLAKSSDSELRSIELLEEAIALSRGELLSGYYDEWILEERRCIASLRIQALRSLCQKLMSISAPDRAIEYAREAVAAEPLDEEAHVDLMRIYVALGQPSTGLRQYAQLKQLLQEELNAQPSALAQSVAAELEASLGHGVATVKRQVRPITSRASELPNGQPGHQINLPPRLSRFFGREDERSYLKSLLSPQGDARLVSLLGLGGIGKTRLAQETAELLIEAYEGRIVFVPLADCTEVNHIGARITRAMHIAPVSDLEPLTQAIAAFQSSPFLLVLDNLEQLMPEATALIEEILMDAPLLRCLVTSRLCVGIEGEHEIALAPLPSPDRDSQFEELANSPSVALFVDRVRAVRHSFTLTPANATDIADLCNMLDGLPLAIELAAARARVMTPAEMKRQGGPLLDWLIDVRAKKNARHRSVRATLEWSFRLLSAEEQRFFILLGVFSGGFTASSASGVALPKESHDCANLLESLREASLLTAEETNYSVMRFTMLETLREFALEQRIECDLENEACARHLSYFADDWWNATIQSPEPASIRWDASRRRRAEADESNLFEAIEFGLRSDASPTEQSDALRLTSKIIGYWELQGRWREGIAILRRARCLPSISKLPWEHMRILQGEGALLNLVGQYEDSHSVSQQGLSLARQAEDQEVMAGCLSNLGTASFYQDDYAGAQAYFEQALALYETLDNPQKVASIWVSLANVSFFTGLHEDAKVRLHHALDLYRDAEDALGIATATLRLGNVWRDQGHFKEAGVHMRNALEIFKNEGHRYGTATSLHDLGFLASFQGDAAQAGTLFEEALAHYRSIGARRGVNICLINLGAVAVDEEDYSNARKKYEEALSTHRKVSDRRNLASLLVNLGCFEIDEGRLNEAESYLNEAMQVEKQILSDGGIANSHAGLGRLAIAQGDLAQAFHHLGEALSVYYKMNILTGVTVMLEAHAELAIHREEWQRAVRLAGASSRLRTETGFTKTTTPRRWKAASETLKSSLSLAEFDQHWQHGASLELADAVKLALAPITRP